MGFDELFAVFLAIPHDAFITPLLCIRTATANLFARLSKLRATRLVNKSQWQVAR
jgi:hypothetical protein